CGERKERNRNMTDRRDFLRYTGAAAMASRAALGAAGAVRTGILGTQHSHLSGKLKAMKDSPDYQVASICEPDAAVRDKNQGDPMYAGLRWVSESELL